MGTTAEQHLAANWPPRRGSILAITVDSTARPYDLTGLAIGQAEAPEQDINRRLETFLMLQAETNDVYFYFDSATGSSLADGTTIGAGSALAYASAYCAVLKAGNQPLKVRIDRAIDKFIILKAASTSGVLRMWVASPAGA